jgi:hypothetical protein
MKIFIIGWTCSLIGETVCWFLSVFLSKKKQKKKTERKRKRRWKSKKEGGKEGEMKERKEDGTVEINKGIDVIVICFTDRL